MKNLLCILAAATLLCGCSGIFAENNKRVEQLNQQMSAEWLKAHVVVGKTTPDEIKAWFGQPVMKSASAGSGIGAALMPDEIWTYSVRFSEADKGGVSRWSKAIAFSFKDGTVSNYNVTSTAF